MVTDSILCYEYYNNANTLSCYEQIYYINIRQRKIWTVMMTFDEESAQADDTNTYLIDYVQTVLEKKTVRMSKT